MKKVAWTLPALLVTSTVAHAQTNSLLFVAVPTLEDTGLVALAVLVGLVGAVVVRRNKNK